LVIYALQLLGPTLGVRNLGGHRWISLANTDDRVSKDVLTSSPPPSLLVKAINIFLSKTIGCSNRRAATTTVGDGESCSTIATANSLTEKDIDGFN
jgi:hypothetical protein